MAAKRRILIDCDPGHDDLVAILFAQRHMDLVGIATVHGNNSVENTTRNALATLELAEFEVPVAAGCAGPLVPRGPAGEAAMHGKGGLAGADLPPPRLKPVDKHAADFIIEQASAHRGELILALIGPQTNAALALAREPRLKDWIAEITVMGGSAGTGNITPAAEYNVHCDPEAAAAVFASGIPIRMVGYNITRQAGFDERDILRMRTSGRRSASVVADLMAFYLGRQQEVFGLTVAPMHDVCALVPYIAPDLLGYADAAVRVELAGTFTRGMTVCDLRNVRSEAARAWLGVQPPNAKVAVSVQARALIDLVVETILQFP